MIGIILEVYILQKNDLESVPKTEFNLISLSPFLE